MVDTEKLLKRVDVLESERGNMLSYWQDMANFCLPRKAFVTTERENNQRLNFHHIFDSTAIRGLNTMASGFSSHLTNPSSKWFNLATRNRAFMKSKDVRLWFKNVEDEIYSTLNSSNFNSVIQEFYSASGCFGTDAVYSQEDLKDRVRFFNIPIKETLIEEDESGRISRVHRIFDYTIQQAWDRWGTVAGEEVTKGIKESTRFNKTMTFVHSVYPRDDRVAGKKDSVNLPYASAWMVKKSKHLISEGGYEENPYAVGRFYKESGEKWGYSPAMNVLADIKMLNAEKRTLIRAAMKIVDPPHLLPSRGFMLPFNLNPAASNYYDPALKTDMYKAIETKGNIAIGIEMIQDVKKDIEEGFFVPLFRAFADITKQMTIPEVQRRIAENMVLLGPVVGRFTQEVFDPIITRVFNILWRNGFLPPPPAIIQEEELDVIYVSQLALAQRQQEVNSIETFLNDVGAMSQFIPSVLDKIDGDKAVDIIAEVKSVNPEIVRSSEIVEKIRIKRAEQEAQSLQLAQLQQGAGIAKDVASAEKDLQGAKK